MIPKAIGAIVLGISMLIAPDTVSAQNSCAGRLRADLERYGISFNKIEDGRWYVDRFTNQGRPGRVSGFRFYGKPSECQTGRLNVNMSHRCGISDIYTTGGCKIDGIRSGWLF